jgi:hypothetical protein
MSRNRKMNSGARFLPAIIVLACLLIEISAPIHAQNLGNTMMWRLPDWGGRPMLNAVQGEGFRLALPEGRSWAAVTRIVSVNVDETPFLAIDVISLGKGASWALKMDNRPYDPQNPHDIEGNPPGGDKTGLYLANLKEMGGWKGRQNIELRLFVIGQPGATVTFGHIFLASSEHNGGVAKIKENEVLGIGDWRCGFSASTSQFIIASPRAFGGISIPMPYLSSMQSYSLKKESNANTILVNSSTDWADFQTRMTVASGRTPILHWTVSADWKQPHALPSEGPECHYMAGSSVNGEATPQAYLLSAHQFGQAGYETGEAFLPANPFIGGTALYVENYSALDPYFEAAHVSPDAAVKAEMNGFGYRIPVNSQKIFPAGTHLLLADSYLILQPGDSVQPLELSESYLRMMATIFHALPHPPTVQTDWNDVAQKTLHDLTLPSCVANTEKSYFRNYVNEPWDSGAEELMTQLDPFVATLMYDQNKGIQTPWMGRVADGLGAFYLPTLHWLSDWNKSDQPTKADSWYLIFPLIQLSRAAMLGNSQAKDLVRESLPYLITYAHVCDYQFPVFYNPQTMGSHEYSEPDCTGAYAYLMLQSEELFKEGSYLNEAKASLMHIAPYGLNYSYEMHLTALSAAACARMWKITGDESYLKLSLIPVANFIRHCWLWDVSYGYHKKDSYFFAVSSMPGAYVAAFEEYQSMLALKEYERIASSHIPADAREMVSEFLRYAPTVLRFTLPPFMAKGSVTPMNGRNHPNDLSLYIPVEDVNDGWTLSGGVGQEIYGSGFPMVLATQK